MKNSTYHHINLKNELIEKGIDLVNKYGVEQLSLRKVAQVCNVSHFCRTAILKIKMS